MTMSERDIQRVEVLTEVTRGGLTAGAAAGVLGVSERQVCRRHPEGRRQNIGPAGPRGAARLA